MPFTALVMSGGGAKGSFQAGALDHLIREMKIDPEVIAGVSTGNLNAAMLAQGRGYAGLVAQLDMLTEIWKGIKKNGDIYRERTGMKIGRLFGLLGGKVGGVTGGVGAAAGALLFGADSVYTNKPLWRMIQAHVRPDRLRSSGRKLRVAVVDLVSGELCVVKETYPHIREMIRASAAVPVFFEPVDAARDGRKYVDGGVRDVTPLKAAIDALRELHGDDAPQPKPPDRIYIILASPLATQPVLRKEELGDAKKIGLRCLDLLVNEIFRNDLQLAYTINSVARLYQGRRRGRGRAAPRHVDKKLSKYWFYELVLIQPEEAYMDSLEFDPAKIRRAFEEGRKKAAADVAGFDSRVGANFDLAMLKWAEGVLG